MVAALAGAAVQAQGLESRRVLEIGRGPLGGFVPMLSVSGYEAVGVDPEAPDEASYRRVEFEQGETFRDVDVVVAATSLHHVADPAEVLDRVASALAPRRTLIVLEWDWDRFDEPTAEWCFRRLGTGEEPSWVAEASRRVDGVRAALERVPTHVGRGGRDARVGVATEAAR